MADKKLRGFANLDPETRRRLASEAGKKAQASGRAHRFTSEEARAAAMKARAKNRKGPVV